MFDSGSISALARPRPCFDTRETGCCAPGREIISLNIFSFQSEIFLLMLCRSRRRRRARSWSCVRQFHAPFLKWKLKLYDCWRRRMGSQKAEGCSYLRRKTSPKSFLTSRATRLHLQRDLFSELIERLPQYWHRYSLFCDEYSETSCLCI